MYRRKKIDTSTIPEAGGIPYSRAVRKSSSRVTSYDSSSSSFFEFGSGYSDAASALFALCCLTCSSNRVLYHILNKSLMFYNPVYTKSTKKQVVHYVECYLRRHKIAGIMKVSLSHYLVHGISQFRECVCHFTATDKQLKSFSQSCIAVAEKLKKKRYLHLEKFS